MSWTEILNTAGAPASLEADYLAPAIAAVPEPLAARLGFCRITLRAELGGELSSQWSQSTGALEIELAAAGADPHDLAIELLFCFGQAVWESASRRERADWLALLDAEIREGVPGEIDEDALEQKQRLLSSRVLANSPRRLERYAAVSFAATLAEFVHGFWHEVTLRAGPDHLPGGALRRRLELLENWFPPGRPLWLP